MGLGQPKWFCGEAKDWALLSPQILATKFRNITNNRFATVLEGLALGGLLLLGPQSMNIKSHTTPEMIFFVGQTLAAILCVISTFAGQLVEGFTLKPSHLISLVGDLVVKVTKKGLSETESLKQLSRAAYAASQQGLDHDRNFTSEGLVAKEVHEIVESEIERRFKKKKNDEAAHTQEMRMAEAARRAAPEGFANMKKDEWKPTTVEGRLGKIKELGADGMAAVSLAMGMMKDGKVDKLEKSELKRIVEDNIPKLLDAWESVPENDRKKVHEVLGDTPENALTRGLSAALTRVLEIRTALSARSRTAIEAEARVLEAKSGLMTP